MSLLNHLPHTATARRPYTTQDALGGELLTYTNLWGGLTKSCWKQPVGDSAASRWQQAGVTITHSIFFNEDPGLREGDEVIVNGVTHDVRSVSAPDASVGLGIVWRASVEEVVR